MPAPKRTHPKQFVTLNAAAVETFEQRAKDIEARILEVHTPYGTNMDPVFSSPDGGDIVSYTRTGDSAIWTGHFLAAEAFQYAATADTAAIANVNAALDGIRALVDITGSDFLARVAIPANSPYAEAIQKEE